VSVCLCIGLNKAISVSGWVVGRWVAHPPPSVWG